MKPLIAVRGTEIKLYLPAPEIKADGTIWMQGMPLLGIDDPEAKKKAIVAVKSKKYSDIPDEFFTRLGNNPNGLWVGTREEWQTQPAKQQHDILEAEKATEKKKNVTIYLSSRGWGDFSPVEWHGNITRPDAEILAECRSALDNGHDVDKSNPTDEELLKTIQSAREKWEGKPARDAANKKAADDDLQRKIDSGFCFACESWCHGDCGHFSNDPNMKLRRDLKQAQREANYGIND
jgi:hypothetical protein